MGRAAAAAAAAAAAQRRGESPVSVTESGGPHFQ